MHERIQAQSLHYVSLPGYSFDCWLMSRGVTLDTLQDKQMLEDFVGAKRGGICGIMGDRYINNQGTCFAYSNTNTNANINDNTNTNNNTNTNTNTSTSTNTNTNQGTCLASHEQRSFSDTNDKVINRNIWYIDANNLYGYAMMQKLPYKDFEFFTTTTLDVILNTPDDSDHGNYIVCDFDYTNECKERTEQVVLMPNKRKINDNELGYRQREKSKARSGKLLHRSEKLILDQNNKTEYMVHYRMLKFYVKMGVKVTKIHRVIKFQQDYICSDYIQNNTNKRATAKTEAEKDVRKLMNNSLYGRMCMNPFTLLSKQVLA